MSSFPNQGRCTLGGCCRDKSDRRHIRRGNAQIADSREKIGLAVQRLEGRIDGEWILGAFTIADLETYAAILAGA